MPTDSRSQNDSSSRSGPEASADAWTIRRILEWTIGYLKSHGSESPRLDAEVLLAHALQCPRIQLYARYDEPVVEAVRTRMRELVKRRAAAEPVAYLVGRREFYSLEFRVTPDVFIPRPDTESLVMEVLTRAKGLPEPRILELGTGSGCIPVAIAVNHTGAQLTTVDISAAALAVAAENAGRHQVSGRLRFVEGDLFAPLDESERFDFVVSNPPYIASGEIPTLQADVRNHEPAGALDGGGDGLDVVRRIVAAAPRFLADRGSVLLEVGAEQATSVVDLFQQAGRYEPAQVVRDLSGLPRVVCARCAASGG